MPIAPTLEEAIDRLIAVASDPTVGRDAVMRAAEALRRTNAYKRQLADDPIRAAVWDVLSVCTVSNEGYVMTEELTALTVPEICKLIDRPPTPSNYAKIGKICANYGYRSVQKNRIWPTTRLLAPRHLW